MIVKINIKYIDDISVEISWTNCGMETLQTPGSTSIQSVDYDLTSRQMRITFKSGERYVYYNVPPSVYKGFENAPSKGKYFQRIVRSRFSFRKAQ